MNKTLAALKTRIDWQLNEVKQQQAVLNEEITVLDEQMQVNAGQISEACASPVYLLPEQEIARLNFVIRQQQLQDELTRKKDQLMTQQEILRQKQTRLGTELKMLEKYLEQKAKEHAKNQEKEQQNFIDEWAIQRN
ncbi:hypothetical protein ACFORL_10450 [Legionella dresdenensis]|uniref:Flagellar FliJ protein n=1 Tax=Legionella dresdenensis TaxID=450200 RepID=A0ABV8CGR3_9GAMM